MRRVQVTASCGHNAPGHPLNEGSVVLHAGANTIKAWDDFKVFAEADQEWFKLLTEHVPVDGKPRVVDPTSYGNHARPLAGARFERRGEDGARRRARAGGRSPASPAAASGPVTGC